MCSTENKETRLEKTLGSVRATDKGRRNKREQKNTKPKKKRKGLHKDRKGNFKGFIICEFASSWTILLFLSKAFIFALFSKIPILMSNLLEGAYAPFRIRAEFSLRYTLEGGVSMALSSSEICIWLTPPDESPPKFMMLPM